MMDNSGLPVERTPLYGREDELAAVQRALDGGARLFSVTGIAGIGKTRLVREVARRIGARWPGGTVLCAFRPATTIDETLAVVMEACGVPPGDALTREARAGRVVDALRARGRTLFVADDIQPLSAEAGALINAWLVRIPELQVVMTGRQPAGLDGEQSLLLQPLALPSSDRTRLDSPAVRLFLRSAANLGAFVDGSSRELEAVAELVQRLDGNPLAIELAAARTPLLSPRAILARISERFSLLRPLQPGLGRGLWESIHDSWSALRPREQQALMQLAVFRGGASLPALDAVLDDDDETSALDVFGRLSLRSLIVSRSGTNTRIDVYESIREFVLLQLASDPELEATLWRRQATWCLSYGWAIAEGKTGAHEGTRVEAIGEELANLLALFREGRCFELNPALRVDVARLYVRLSLWMTRFLSLSDLLAPVTWALAKAEPLTPELRIRLAGLRLLFRSRLGERAQAEQAFDEMMAFARTTGDSHLVGLALNQTGAMASFLPAETVIQRLTEAVALMGPTGAPEDVGHALADIGFALARSGDVARADVAFAQSIGLLETSDAVEVLVAALNNWGVIHTLHGNWDRARELLTRALSIARASDHRFGVCVVSCSLGECELKDGQLDTARTLFADALEDARELGVRSHRVQAAGYLAAIEHFTGALEAAHAHYTEAVAYLGEDWAQLETEGIVHSARGLVLAQLGRNSASLADFQKAHTALTASADVALLAAHRIHRLGADVAVGITEPKAALAEAEAVAAEVEATKAPRRAHVQHALTLLQTAISLAPDSYGPRPTATAGVLAVSDKFTRLRLPDGRDVDLRRSARSRAIVAHLIRCHQEAPGVPVSMGDLFDAAWPDDRTPEPHRSNRVYVALSRLRASGFGDVVIHDGEGYMVDPSVRVVIEDDSVCA